MGTKFGSVYWPSYSDISRPNPEWRFGFTSDVRLHLDWSVDACTQILRKFIEDLLRTGARNMLPQGTYILVFSVPGFRLMTGDFGRTQHVVSIFWAHNPVWAPFYRVRLCRVSCWKFHFKFGAPTPEMTMECFGDAVWDCLDPTSRKNNEPNPSENRSNGHCSTYFWGLGEP